MADGGYSLKYLETFELIVLHIREYGYEAVFAGDVYTQYDCGDHFYWTMGHSLPTTVVLNRKPFRIAMLVRARAVGLLSWSCSRKSEHEPRASVSRRGRNN